MKIDENIEMLELDGDRGRLYPVLLHDDKNLILVDTGFPMQMELLRRAVSDAGFKIEDVNKIILTHQDIDHIGCVKDVLEISPEAEVLAHTVEAPYIDGRDMPIKLAAMDKDDPFYPFLKSGFEARRIKIDKELEDGDVLPCCGGIEIIHTPGHTPGHICLYLPTDKVLIAGDALNIDNGSLTVANPVYTQDMALANQSVLKLGKFEILTVVTYHGGRYDGDFTVKGL